MTSPKPPGIHPWPGAWSFRLHSPKLMNMLTVDILNVKTKNARFPCKPGLLAWWRVTRLAGRSLPHRSFGKTGMAHIASQPLLIYPFFATRDRYTDPHLMT